jgi:3',5'-cyclic AMP phosphodiesterase CpdA
MRRIAHLSDLHFGAHDPAIVEALIAGLAELAPDVVVVSGDVTQRARPAQFRAADAFLSRIEAAGCPVVLVPGNHDIPLYDVARRFLSPLRRWRRHVAGGRRECLFDDDVAIVGLNTARSLTFKDGRLSIGQINGLVQEFSRASPNAMRILVTHHPLVPLRGQARERPASQVGRASLALTAIRAARVGILLAGHMHHAGVEHGPADVAQPSADPRILVVQAGTATSWRRRGTPNSFNLLRIEPAGAVTVELMEADANASFVPRLSCSYSPSSRDGGWHANASATEHSPRSPSSWSPAT